RLRRCLPSVWSTTISDSSRHNAFYLPIIWNGFTIVQEWHLRRPPRPMSWPFIGNLLHVGDQIHISMTNMRDKYGDVFQMRMGSIVVVVLIRQGESFAGRPELFSFSAVANGTSMTFSEKYTAKLGSSIRRSSSTFSCLLEEHVCCEASETVDRLKEHSNCESGFDATIALITSVANVVCALSFGKRYSYNDEEFLNIVQINNEVLRIFAAGNLADFFPIFRYFPSPSLKKMVHHIRKINGFMEQNFKDHLRTYDKNCIRDITDPLIALCEDREDGKKFTLSNTQIVHTVIVITRTKCFDTIIAGLQWSLLYLIKFPDIQSKIYKEIGTAFSDIISHITFAQNFTFPLILGIKQKYSHIMLIDIIFFLYWFYFLSIISMNHSQLSIHTVIRPSFHALQVLMQYCMVQRRVYRIQFVISVEHEMNG
uniref:Cytochrome P450 1A n=1 Tax=Paramormyrops kingsleyae TaxID=1676925 RepID=A0A3B3R2F7_9TELE